MPRTEFGYVGFVGDFNPALITSSHPHEQSRASTSSTDHLSRPKVFPLSAAAAVIPNPVNSSHHRFLKVHFVRHAQGRHNADKIYNEPAYKDARLTERGKAQAADLRQYVAENLSSCRFVVVSPISRAIETALIAFGSPTASPCTFIALELCRERIGLEFCDNRRTLTELRQDFPSVDFSRISDNEDVLFAQLKEDTDEDPQAIGPRAMEFVKALDQLAQEHHLDEMAVFSHGFFYKALFKYALNCQQYSGLLEKFRTCELRSVVLSFE